MNDNKDAKVAIFKTYQIVWYIFGALEILLGFRFVLRMLGANTGSSFVQFIYNISQPFVRPFWGIFGVSTPVADSALEWSTLFAMLAYAVLAWLIVSLLRIAIPVNSTEAERQLNA